MLKEILQEAVTKPKLMTLKELQTELESMDDAKLKKIIKEIFADDYDTNILLDFMHYNYSDDVYNLSEKAKQKLWNDLQKRIEKVLKKMKREDLLALKDLRTCAIIVRKELKDEDSKFCEYVRDTIYRELGKMFDNDYSELRYWMNEYKFCEELNDLSDKDLCEIKNYGIDKIEIKDLDSDEYISVGTRASVFTSAYEVKINGHIKFKVSKSEINRI